ncbi:MULTISPECIES: glycoside hydrolase family 2 TIM barrel-domain containing protein [unclassified Rathayibacter]|uniref:glycoside hydrolase family 2 TIM barrel-domain containing protein n=1 Tax=unclassified Rathayibacter TaxID=2609250 RepID=UPI001C6126C0|nr:MULTISPECIES: glycoside hydrolase family 2 TIM barrel-domain containing protein [unclassified Rathayibacter]
MTTPPTTSHYLTDTGPGSGRRRAARSWLHTDAPALPLDGEWRFRLLPAAPGTPGGAGVLPEGEGVDAVGDESFDDSGWDLMRVPSHWVLQGDGRYGLPAYTNVQFPFPTEPPFVPDANPTGDYRRTVVIPEEWDSAEAVVLRFDGVESRYRVWVNGVEIGIGSGSRLAQEFDVTGVVRPGENLVVVRVHQWSASSYVEDQDQWWLPGIFRSVHLLARPVGGIEDVWLRSSFAGGAGRIEAEVTAAADAFPLTLRVPGLGIETVWASAEEIAAIEVPEVEPWSAEAPRLYDATLASAGETVSLRLGFRTVEIRGDRFLVNGERVVFHGVNRHETHPDRGRAFDEDSAREDLAMMKRFNVNAIRTSHYPPHPRLLDLADELGFWVVLECDLETHGFERVGWAGNPSDDPAWREAYLDRIERTVERDKNHPSIVLWSLGNEAGTGANLAAMSAWVHGRDPERPVHYEGDYTGAYTDVYSRMYSSIPETERIGTDGSLTPLLGCSPGESARQRSKPFLLCEYVHAMGNGPGAIDQYEDLVDRFPRLHGGFVWEWRDHGLRARTPDGVEYYAYGGDFGEVVHDGNFVMDGMVLSDGTPSPGLFEWKQIVAPVRLTVRGDGVVIENRRHDASTADLRFAWRVERDGRVTAEGVLDAPVIAAGDAVHVELPPLEVRPGGETWLTVDAVLDATTAWAEEGHVLSTGQHLLAAPSAVPAWTRAVRSAPPLEGGALGVARFRDGRLSSLAGLPVDGPRAELWRAPTDNDEGEGFPGYVAGDPFDGDGRGTPAPSSAARWREAGLDRLVGRVQEVDASAGLRRVTRFSAADLDAGLLMEERWSVDGESTVLRVDLVPTRGWDSVWPRLGIRIDLPASIDGAEWFGTGPLESYPDSLRAARVGRFTAAMDRLTTPYARPQESGHRSSVRELTLMDAGSPRLRIEAARDLHGRLPGFTLARHTPQEITSAAHPHELPESERAVLVIDAAQHGLGSRACGPDVWPDFQLRPEARTILLRFTAAG